LLDCPACKKEALLSSSLPLFLLSSFPCSGCCLFFLWLALIAPHQEVEAFLDGEQCQQDENNIGAGKPQHNFFALLVGLFDMYFFSF